MKTLRIILKYIRYFFTAKSKHAIQSPFLYEFVTEVMHKKTNNPAYQSINNLRKELYKCEK